MSKMTGPVSPDALFSFDSLLESDEVAVRATDRRLVEQRIKPFVAEWYSRGNTPVRELALELGGMGLLGMQLEGCDCAGMSAAAYGLACLELEAGDSDIRSLVSVQGSLAMYAIHAYGSEEQRVEWLPRMVSGEILGCFGLIKLDFGSNAAGMRTSAKKDGPDWVLNGSKMWISSGSVADVAVVWAHTDDGIRGFVVLTETPGFTANTIEQKMSMLASVTSELVLNDVRLPGSAVLLEAKGLSGPLGCLVEARFAFRALGEAHDCLLTTMEFAGSRTVRPTHRGFPVDPVEARGYDAGVRQGNAAGSASGSTQGCWRTCPATGKPRQAQQRPRAIAIAHECRTILGGSGITMEYPVMRHANDLESVLTYEGTSEIDSLVIGQTLTGLSAFR